MGYQEYVRVDNIKINYIETGYEDVGLDSSGWGYAPVANSGAQESAYGFHKTKKLNSVALVRKRTIPTEGPPLVAEVGVNLCG
jgi:hypothetical protein